MSDDTFPFGGSRPWSEANPFCPECNVWTNGTPAMKHQPECSLAGKDLTMKKPEPQMPPDPMTVLGAGASEIHELYASFLSAGFSEEQAFTLVLEMWRTVINRTPQQ